ncbi:MAG: hypothetical protein HFH46_01145 [Bacilli bacterium]|nr:hypothetical protein [Bacilli bacterium]
MLELVNLLATEGTTSCAGVDIPNGIYNLIHTIILMIQIVVPILLIIWGMIDFAKAIIGGDEDKIKAGQKTFIKRLIAAIVVFLVVTIVSLLISLVGSLGAENVQKDTITECLDHFIKGV